MAKAREDLIKICWELMTGTSHLCGSNQEHAAQYVEFCLRWLRQRERDVNVSHNILEAGSPSRSGDTRKTSQEASVAITADPIGLAVGVRQTKMLGSSGRFLGHVDRFRRSTYSALDQRSSTGPSRVVGRVRTESDLQRIPASPSMATYGNNVTQRSRGYRD